MRSKTFIPRKSLLLDITVDGVVKFKKCISRSWLFVALHHAIDFLGSIHISIPKRLLPNVYRQVQNYKLRQN